MPTDQYAALFEPISINTLRLPNRIVMPAMHTMFAEADGAIGERMIAYHAERARGGVGLQILENTCVDWSRGRANGTPARIDENAFVPGLHDLTAAVHRAGGRIAAQLHHSGRQNTTANTSDRVGTVAPSAIPCKVCLDEPSELTVPQIEALIERFADAALRARKAGFDLVELHGAHGYLVHQFVSPYTNRREDEWGGTREKRFRFACEIARRVREAVGPDYPVMYRMSAEDRLEGGLELEDSIALARALQGVGVDAFHVSAGMYESMDWIFMMHGTPPGGIASLAEEVRAHVDVPVVAVGRLGHDPALAARLVAERRVDLVAFGRPLLTEPRLPELLRNGRFEEARPCIACNACVGGLFDQWRVTCVANPELGREREGRRARLARRTTRVVVVGGGPAGMEVATRLAEQGGAVTLLEQADALGGALRAAVVPAHKQPELPRLLRYLTARVEASGVEVVLGGRADVAAVAGLRPDIVVDATGGVPVVPAVPGVDAPQVAHVADLLRAGEAPQAAEAVVVGASHPGLDCALWLRQNGVGVTVVEAGPEPGEQINPILRAHLLGLLAEAGGEVRAGTTLLAVEPTAVRVAGVSGEATIAAGLVVLALGTCPSSAALLAPEGVPVHRIGSAAVASGTLLDATQMALDVLELV